MLGNIAQIARRAAAFAAMVAAVAGCAVSPETGSITSGGCAPETSQYLQQAPHVVGRITYCGKGDADTGTVLIGQFPAGTHEVELMIAGYGSTPGMRLEAHATGSSEAVELPLQSVGDHWKRVGITMPASLAKNEFTLSLVDQATTAFGWAGVGTSTKTLKSLVQAAMRTALAVLLGALCCHLWLLLCATSLPLAWSAERKLLAGMLALGGTSMLVVAAFVVSVPSGQATALAAVVAPIAAMAAALRRRPAGLRFHPMSQVNALLIPSLTLALFALWIGLYPFDWNGADGSVPANRWSPLPADSWLPLLFAEMVRAGRLDVPMYGDWLASDRPPLQSGLYLIFAPLWHGTPGFLYQGLASYAQALVLVPLAALLRPKLAPGVRVAVLFGVATSALVVVNTVFVWPKLLAAAYCVIFHLCLFHRGRDRISTVMAAVAATLAMLSHGGALFILIGSVVAYLLGAGREQIIRLVRIGVASLCAYAPWVYFQRVLDPPGDRLLKWHFAGQVAVTDRPLLEVMGAAYRGLTPTAWWASKVDNVRMLAGEAGGVLRDLYDLLAGAPGDVRSHIAAQTFFSMAYATWFATPALLLPLYAARLAWKRGGSKIAAPRGLWPAMFASLVFWVLMMFQPGSTVIHQGAYLSAIFMLVAMLLVADAVSRTLLYGIVAANATLFAVLYVFDPRSTYLPYREVYGFMSMGLMGSLLAATWYAVRAASSPTAPSLEQSRGE